MYKRGHSIKCKIAGTWFGKEWTNYTTNSISFSAIDSSINYFIQKLKQLEHECRFKKVIFSHVLQKMPVVVFRLNNRYLRIIINFFLTNLRVWMPMSGLAMSCQFSYCNSKKRIMTQRIIVMNKMSHRYIRFLPNILIQEWKPTIHNKKVIHYITKLKLSLKI